MTPTSAAASYLARFFGQDAVTIQSNPGGRGEAVEGGALTYEDATLLGLTDVVERMITRALANAN